MKKILIICVILVIAFLVFHDVKTNDIRNSFNNIVEKFKEKKPEERTEQKVQYLKTKAEKDIEHNSSATLKYALKYIDNNIEDATSTRKLENLIYYGYVLQYSPKESDMGMCTTIGIKTVDAATEVYVKDNDYKKNKTHINKTKAQIIKALISRVDIK